MTAPGTGGARAYECALAALAGALKFGIHPSLDGIRALTDALDRPQERLRVVQVTGTNGKSSVSRLVAALLRAHGERVGLYTSPHLVSYPERMEIDGAPIAEEDFGRAVLAAVDVAERLGGEYTEFELLTAAALHAFAEAGCGWAVLEVGLGGRWDATSVTSPEVAVVTGVGLDHTDRLGDTLEAIAFDKAHIIKPGSRAVIGPGTLPVADVFRARAAEVGAPLTSVSADAVAVLERPSRPDGVLRLAVRTPRASYDALVLAAPVYQAVNTALAMHAVEAALGRALDPGPVRGALATMRFPGRFELLSAAPPLVIDGAHNPQAAAVLAEAIADAFPGAPPTLVLGVLADKDAEGIVAALAPAAGTLIATSPDSPRALPAEELAALVERVSGRTCEAVPRVHEAVARARALGEGVVVTGSLYTVGEVRAELAR